MQGLLVTEHDDGFQTTYEELKQKKKIKRQERDAIRFQTTYEELKQAADTWKNGSIDGLPDYL